MDREPLVRVHEYLDSFGLESEICRRSDGLWTIHHHTQAAWDLFASFRLTDEDGDDWHAGLLGGLYDAEGSQYIITQSARRNPETCRLIDGAFRRLGLRHQTYNHVRRHHPEHSTRGFRLLGGRLAFYRFCDLTRPALTRKLSAWLGANAARFTIAHPKISRIETLPGIHRVHTLTTETGNYVAYGMGSKNCAARATKWSRWDVTGASHLDELHRRISDVVLRRLKSECLDLPEKTRILRKAELSTEAQQRYTVVLNEMQAEYRRRKAAGEIQEADTLVLMNHLRHAGSVAKVETATELAEEVIEQGGQVVLFTAFKDSAESLAAALSAGKITGDQNADQRQEAIDKFQAGELKTMVCTLGAGNVGITLTAAQTVILVDRAWTPGDNLQSEDRLHRIGQRNAVTSIWLQANGCDEAIDQLLLKKQERIDLVLAGKRRTLRGIESIGQIADAFLGIE